MKKRQRTIEMIYIPNKLFILYTKKLEKENNLNFEKRFSSIRLFHRYTSIDNKQNSFLVC